jgi:hypothetical protein
MENLTRIDVLRRVWRVTSKPEKLTVAFVAACKLLLDELPKTARGLETTFGDLARKTAELPLPQYHAADSFATDIDRSAAPIGTAPIMATFDESGVQVPAQSPPYSSAAGREITDADFVAAEANVSRATSAEPADIATEPAEPADIAAELAALRGLP